MPTTDDPVVLRRIAALQAQPAGSNIWEYNAGLPNTPTEARGRGTRAGAYIGNLRQLAAEDRLEQYVAADIERVQNSMSRVDAVTRRLEAGVGVLDLNIAQGVAATGVRRIAYRFGDTGEVAAGVQKLATDVVVRLLESERAGGTGFIDKLRRGVLRTEADARLRFALDADTIVKQLREKNEDTLAPADERLESLTLLAASRIGDQMTLTIELQTEAGELRPVLIPIPDVEELLDAR